MPRPTPSERPVTAVAGPVTRTGGGGSGGGTGEALAGAIGTASNPLLAWLVTTTGGILLFLFLLRRGTRNDDERPGDFVFARAVAAPLAGPPVPLLPHRGTSPADTRTGGTVPAKPTRKAAPKKAARSTETPPTGSGSKGGQAAAAKVGKGNPRSSKKSDKSAKSAKQVDRAKISYRRVRLNSEPDDVHSVELGRLDRGDEVEILDSHEGFLRVRTVGGMEGWIQRHTIVP